MRTLELKVNGEIMLYGKRHTVMAIDPPNVTLKRTGGDAEVFDMDYFQLIFHPMFKAEVKETLTESSLNRVTLLDTLNEQYRTVITTRFEIIRPIILYEQATKNSDTRSALQFYELFSKFLREGETIYKVTQEVLINRIAEEYNFNKRSIKRYLSNYRQAERSNCRGENGLIPDYGKGHLQRKDNYTINICHPEKEDWVLDIITTRLTPDLHPIIKLVIEQHYLKLKRISKKETYRLIEYNCIKAGITPPALSTINKLIDRIDPKIRDKMRIGVKAVKEYQPVDRGFTNEEALFPLHIVAMDHTQLDMDVIDIKTGCEIGRPYITIGIDFFSRQIWCVYISFEHPSANVIRKAIQQGMFIKRSKEIYGTQCEWVVHGIPYNIMVDNGKDFRSIETERMVNEVMKSNLIFRPRRTPNYAGVVERFFKHLNDAIIHQINGTTKSNVSDKGEYKSAEEAVLTLEELQSYIIKYIVDIYPYEIHRGLPIESAKPFIRYMEGCKEVGLPRSVRREDEHEYYMELLPTYLKPYTKDGVVHNSVSYKSDTLNSLIDSEKVQYTIKYDPDDISKIFFLHPEKKEYIEVFASQPSAELLEGMNLHVYKALRKKWKAETEEKSKGLPTDDEIKKLRAKMTEEMQNLYKKNRRVRQQTQKMNLPISVGLEQPKIANVMKKPTTTDLLNMAKRAQERLK